MKFSGGGSPPNDYTEIDVVDGASSIGFKLIIHIHTFLNVGEYQLKQSNFQEQGNSVPFNHIYFKIWDTKISNYAYYGSIVNEGKLKINRRDNGIISGFFQENLCDMITQMNLLLLLTEDLILDLVCMIKYFHKKRVLRQ